MDTNPHIRQGTHPTPRTYIAIAALLAVITAVEVWIFYLEALKDVLIPIFIVLSAVKFALVAMFYMHLKFDDRLFSAFFVGGLILAASVITALMALFGVLLNTPSFETAAETHESQGDHHTETVTTETEHHGESSGGFILEIGTAGDNLSFNADSLTVTAGIDVVLKLNNDATTQQHNWVLVQDGAKDAISAAGLTAGADNDWVPEDDRIIAHTDLISPGKSGEVQFTTPSAGKYQFVCTFPGHGASMFGTFEVTS